MIPQRAAFAWHVVLLGLFLVATAWTAGEVRAGLQERRDVASLVVFALATLGFISLSLRELGILRHMMRRHDPGSSQRAA